MRGPLQRLAELTRTHCLLAVWALALMTQPIGAPYTLDVLLRGDFQRRLMQHAVNIAPAMQQPSSQAQGNHGRCLQSFTSSRRYRKQQKGSDQEEENLHSVRQGRPTNSKRSLAPG